MQQLSGSGTETAAVQQQTACAVNNVPHHRPRHQHFLYIFNEMMSRAALTLIVNGLNPNFPHIYFSILHTAL